MYLLLLINKVLSFVCGAKKRATTKQIYVRLAGMAPDAHCSLIISHQFKSQCSLLGLIISRGQIHCSSIKIFSEDRFLNRPGEGYEKDEELDIFIQSLSCSFSTLFFILNSFPCIDGKPIGHTGFAST